MVTTASNVPGADVCSEGKSVVWKYNSLPDLNEIWYVKRVYNLDKRASYLR
jgi:hypothetical protein